MERNKKDHEITAPIMAVMMYPLNKRCLIGYKNCQIREGNIVFTFSTKLQDQFSEIEDIFRNRLGRKFSFISSEYEFTVLVNPQSKEDLTEYFIAAQILDLYYRGKEQSEERIAEYAAYMHGENWRDISVVNRYLDALWKAQKDGENWRDITALHRYL